MAAVCLLLIVVGFHGSTRSASLLYFVETNVSSRLPLWTRPADIVMWKLLLCVLLERFEWTLSHVADRKNSNQRPFGWSAWRKPPPACHQWCEELWWMVNLREPDWKCTFHCCLPGPHQHEQFVQIYLRAVKSSAKKLSSFCTAVEPRALPLILSDKLWNKTRSSTHTVQAIGPNARPCIQLSRFLHLVIVSVRSLRTRTRRTKRRRCWCTSLLGGGRCQGWSQSS